MHGQPFRCLAAPSLALPGVLKLVETTSQQKARKTCYQAILVASQCSLHNAPIFRLLLKVAVNGTHQCESLNFCGTLVPTDILFFQQSWTSTGLNFNRGCQYSRLPSGCFSTTYIIPDYLATAFRPPRFRWSKTSLRTSSFVFVIAAFGLFGTHGQERESLSSLTRVNRAMYTFSAFWLWSSVVSVLISVTADMSPTGDLHVTTIFQGEESAMSLLWHS